MSAPKVITPTRILKYCWLFVGINEDGDEALIMCRGQNGAWYPLLTLDPRKLDGLKAVAKAWAQETPGHRIELRRMVADGVIESIGAAAERLAVSAH